MTISEVLASKDNMKATTCSHSTLKLQSVWINEPQTTCDESLEHDNTTPRQQDNMKTRHHDTTMTGQHHGSRTTRQHEDMTTQQHDNRTTPRQQDNTTTPRQHDHSRTTPQHDDRTTPRQHDDTTTARQQDNMTTCQHDDRTTPWQQDNTTAAWRHDNMTAAGWHDRTTPRQHDDTMTGQHHDMITWPQQDNTTTAWWHYDRTPRQQDDTTTAGRHDDRATWQLWDCSDTDLVTKPIDENRNRPNCRKENDWPSAKADIKKVQPLSRNENLLLSWELLKFLLTTGWALAIKLIFTLTFTFDIFQTSLSAVTFTFHLSTVTACDLWCLQSGNLSQIISFHLVWSRQLFLMLGFAPRLPVQHLHLLPFPFFFQFSSSILQFFTSRVAWPENFRRTAFIRALRCITSHSWCSASGLFLVPFSWHCAFESCSFLHHGIKGFCCLIWTWPSFFFVFRRRLFLFTSLRLRNLC